MSSQLRRSCSRAGARAAPARTAPGHQRMRATVHLAILFPFLTGCAASSKLIRYGKLEVNTEVTESVFLEPGVDSRTIHVSLTNTSGVDAPLRSAVEPLLREAGWRLVDSPEDATYLLQVNVLQVTRQLLDENQDLRETVTPRQRPGLLQAWWLASWRTPRVSPTKCSSWARSRASSRMRLRRIRLTSC